VLRAARFERSSSAGVSAGWFAFFVVEVADLLECWDCGGQCGGLIARQLVDELRECLGAGLASVPEVVQAVGGECDQCDALVGGVRFPDDQPAACQGGDEHGH